MGRVSVSLLLHFCLNRLLSVKISDWKITPSKLGIAQLVGTGKVVSSRFASDANHFQGNVLLHFNTIQNYSYGHSISGNKETKGTIGLKSLWPYWIVIFVRACFLVCKFLWFLYLSMQIIFIRSLSNSIFLYRNHSTRLW